MMMKPRFFGIPDVEIIPSHCCWTHVDEMVGEWMISQIFEAGRKVSGEYSI